MWCYQITIKLPFFSERYRFGGLANTSGGVLFTGISSVTSSLSISNGGEDSTSMILSGSSITICME